MPLVLEEEICDCDCVDQQFIEASNPGAQLRRGRASGSSMRLTWYSPTSVVKTLESVISTQLSFASPGEKASACRSANCLA